MAVTRTLCASVCLVFLLCKDATAFVAPWTTSIGVRGQVTIAARDYDGTSKACLMRRGRSARMMAGGFGEKAAKAKKPKSMRRVPTASQACPCFSGKLYGECCEPFHKYEKSPTPVELMRSRYAAYACAMPQYIMKSTHPDHKEFGKPNWSEEILVFCNNYRFTGLEVDEPEMDPDTPGKAHVYFTAMMAGADCGGAVSFDERSIFLLEDGQWLYREADEDYEASVDVVSKRRYNRAARMDKPKGTPAR